MTTQPAPKPATRIGEIDALRGIAAIAVVLFHFTTRIDELFTMNAPASLAFPYGYLGVNLFFIISGYVIFMTLERTRRPMDFVVSRFSRLFPAYWVAIGLTFAVTHSLGLPDKLVSAGDALLNLAMIHNLFKVPHVDGVYWTLEVELLFYAGMYILWRSGRLYRVHPVLWGMLALRLVYHWVALWFGVDLPWRIYKLLILGYIPWFAIGISLYLVIHPRTPADARASWITIAASLALLCVVTSPWIALVTLVMAGLVWAAAGRRLSWLSHPAMVWLGSISYTLYLLHENIGWSLQLQFQTWGLQRDVGIALAIAACLALASALSSWVEKPAMDWIRRRWRARSTP